MIVPFRVIDPKQALTKLSPLEPAHPAAAVLASMSHPDPAQALIEQFSISTVEELVALATVDARRGTDLVGALPLDRDALRGLVDEFRASPAGAVQVTTWPRYDAFTYTTGLEPPLAEAPVANGDSPPIHMVASVSLVDELAPVRDQGHRGTCTAFAGVACLEYEERSKKPDLSEQYAYWNMVERTQHHDLVSMFLGLRDAGTCAEATWPYAPEEALGNDAQGPPPSAAASEAGQHRARAVHQLPARGIAKIKHAIAARHPVAVGIPVYASWFESPIVRKYGNITLPLPTEVREPAGHAFALVGYTDDADFAGGGYFIVRNSWGANWATEGELGPGYGTLPYRYVEDLNWDAWHALG